MFFFLNANYYNNIINTYYFLRSTILNSRLYTRTPKNLKKTPQDFKTKTNDFITTIYKNIR